MLRGDSVEVPFMPARVILQDFTGVPAVVDFAAMRDAVQVEFCGRKLLFLKHASSHQALGGDPETINPLCPSDLVIDHSVQVTIPEKCSFSSTFMQVDVSGTKTSQAQNEEREFERNRERFLFLKWGAKAFKNMLIVPPGSGIVHQVLKVDKFQPAIILSGEPGVPGSSCV